MTTSAGRVGRVGIGAVASFLGVGGSIMTVPLLRRFGLLTAASAVMADTLSVPVSIVRAAVYASAVPTIFITKRVVGRMPDHVHAIAFIALLMVVLASMLVIRPG